MHCSSEESRTALIQHLKVVQKNKLNHNTYVCYTHTTYIHIPIAADATLMHINHVSEMNRNTYGACTKLHIMLFKMRHCAIGPERKETRFGQFARPQFMSLTPCHYKRNDTYKK